MKNTHKKRNHYKGVYMERESNQENVVEMFLRTAEENVQRKGEKKKDLGVRKDGNGKERKKREGKEERDETKNKGRMK